MYMNTSDINFEDTDILFVVSLICNNIYVGVSVSVSAPSQCHNIYTV